MAQERARASELAAFAPRTERGPDDAMPNTPYRSEDSTRLAIDPALRDLLTFLRDTFRAAAARIDHYLGEAQHETGVHMKLNALRDEARRISNEAANMDPADLRLHIEAITAETRALQNRATDPEDQDIAAKILRALTAIVSEHRPGHVYGLARHHQADWDEVARRARAEIASRSERGPER